MDNLVRELKNEIDKFDAKISVVFKLLEVDGKGFDINGDIQIPSASLIKVPIMLKVLENCFNDNNNINELIAIKEENKVDFSITNEIGNRKFTIYELISWMIIESDNSATNELIDLVGFDLINEMIKKLGAKNTILQRKMMDFKSREKGIDNLTTPNDMALFMECIYSDKLLSENVADTAEEILKRQRDKSKLFRYIYHDLEIANKSGSLDGIVHDIGIFYIGSRSYVFGVFMTDVKDNEEGCKMIGRLTNIVLDNIDYIKF